MQPSKQIRPRRAPSSTTRLATAKPLLRFTPEAWGKLSLRRDLDDHRVRGFGISPAADPLVIEDILFLHRHDGADALDDAEVVGFFAREIERELPVDRYARVWVGTRPGRSARPAPADDAMFVQLFGALPWSVMCLVSHAGATYARLRYRVGPGGTWSIPVVVDEPRLPTSVDHDARSPETDDPIDIADELEPDDVQFRPEDWPVTM